MKKILMILCIAIIMSVITISNIGCFANSIPQVFDEAILIENLGGLYESSEFLLEDNSVIELRRIFVNREFALNQINFMIGDFIKHIQAQYFLTELSFENFKDYDDALWDYRLENYGYPGNAPYEVMAFNYFLSVLSNYENNKLKLEMSGMNDDVHETFGLLGNITDNTNIVLNGERVNLYSCFEDSAEALNKVKLLTADLLEYMINEYDLEELNSSNYREFQSYLRWVDSDCFSFEIELLNFFFDIYENDEKNDEIISYLESNISTASVSLDDNNGLYLISLLPKDTQLHTSYMETLRNRPQTFSLYDKYAAYNYAVTYATVPNTDGYEYFLNGDCTNFASQILDAGGISQSMGTGTSNEYFGWWHVYNASTRTHSYSRSWRFVGDFVMYFGIYDEFSASEYTEFSYTVDLGDIIVLDSIDNEDYDWDHIGFVGSDPVYDSNTGTFDFYVIQHTFNYQDWASNTGWCAYNNYNGYAIIRPN